MTRPYLLGIALLVVAFILFGQVRGHQFVNYDDPAYVSDNSHVMAGLSREGVLWAFTATDDANWFPLTWLSHMMDVQLFGMNPGAHHLVNVLIHGINSFLLLLVLNRLSGMLWRSLFVAALFMLHPLHVESVAWVSERKDILCSLFFMLTLLAYVRYVDRPVPARYSLVLFLFICGLMAKPMLVTLPFVLMLLDYWPLRRFEPGATNIKFSFARSFLGKIPLLVLSTASCVVTFMVQNGGGAVARMDDHSLAVNIANALYSYIKYMYKTAWPIRLSVFYPHPGESLGTWQVAGSALILVLISMLAFVLRRKHPYFIVGWLWYLGMLLPVIGLVRIGSHGLADRYTYLPLIGLFVMLSWGGAELARRFCLSRPAMSCLVVMLLTTYGTITWQQTGYWADSITLFRRAVAVTEGNPLAQNMLGAALTKNNDAAQAVPHFMEAMRLKPDYVNAHYNLGFAYALMGETDKAIVQYRIAITLQPGDPDAHANLALAYAQKELYPLAIEQYQQVLVFDPGNAAVRCSLGRVYVQSGAIDSAIEQYQLALKLRPDHPEMHYLYGLACEKKGWLDMAVHEYRRVLMQRNGDANIHNRLGVVLAQQGKTAAAIEEFYKAVSLNPNMVEFASNLRKVRGY